MGADIGFNTQTPSLPTGGGAMTGLGETFTPDLSSGTGSYTVRLDTPNGPNEINPGLALRYDTGNGNGPFGLGFSLPLPRLLRSAALGTPRYGHGDRLMLEGAGELLVLADGSIRPEVDGGAWRVEREGAGFRLHNRDGLRYLLGVNAAARLSDPASGTGSSERVAAWHLERIEDPLGNAVEFSWLRDGGQLYPSSIRYGPYAIRFNWEARPDVIRSGRNGFLVSSALRCASIELLLPSASQPLLRRWTLGYEQDPANGVSLLCKVLMSGFDGALARLDAPPLRFAYSGFATRALSRFTGADLGCEPGPLRGGTGRAELVDWEGRGLPDLLEIKRGGSARLWPNLGACTWGRPRSLPPIPQMASADAALAFADMNGDGIADLVRTDRFAEGYLPRMAGGGFGRPVAWTQAPAVRHLTPACRMADLDGDGRLDLLVSSAEGLSLYYRSDPDGWAPQPQVVPRGLAPPLDLADPHVFVADMSGSGASDLVRVDGGGVTWWPYLGLGRWGAPVIMDDPPALPFDLQPDRLFLSDVDGDGCADLIYLDGGRVVVWINQGGNRFSPPRVIDYVPAGSIRNARLADMRGSGTAGLLWSATGPFDRGTVYYYLDFSGDSKPHLLTEIDNGLGLRTTIRYTTSAQAAAEARRAGRPWTTSLPVVVPVVAAIETRDTGTGFSSTETYRYVDGRYDGELREFAGFGKVEHTLLGDASIPTLRTTHWFHLGLEPDGTEGRTRARRHRLRALRGRLLRRERADPGLPGPFERMEQDWTVAEETIGEATVYLPRLVAMREMKLDSASAASPAVSSIDTVNLAWDAAGNVTETLQSAGPGSPSLRTLNSYAHDPAGRFLARLWRTRQLDGAGRVVADTITEFDGAPQGQVGSEGLVTARLALALTDSQAAELYGTDLPDLAALGYFRQTGSAGWWIRIAAYGRTIDVTGLSGSVRGPRGGLTRFRFDAQHLFPVQLSTPVGNTLHANYDLRCAKLERLQDAAGAVYLSRHDALARLVATVAPGDTEALPTTEYGYDGSVLPCQITQRQRRVSGALATLDTRERFDGAARPVERRVRDETGDIVVAATQYNARGLAARVYSAYRPAAAAYAAPTPAMPHTALFYDALGRPAATVNVDGSRRSMRYGPSWIDEADEESNRTDAGAPHAGVLTRRRLDATGRVRAIEQHVDGRVLVSRYDYDIKGNLLLHTDALGNKVRFAYDLLGRKLLAERPEQSTVSVFDAAGNLVETRSGGKRVRRDYDAANRLLAERIGNAAPHVRYTWHDKGVPAPGGADAFSVGQLVRVDDRTGITRYGYDARGRIARKRWQAAGSAKVYALDFRYGSDGQLLGITYPDGGAGRLALVQHYDARGQLDAVPGVVSKFEYDLAGRRTGARYANGVIEARSYDGRGRLTGIRVTGPGGVLLRQLDYRLDLAGNLAGVDSPDARLAADYDYDDLYRLTGAQYGDGAAWTYAYDDAGRLTHKSDVGDYRYGEGDLPATCLSSAGADGFSYTERGEMSDTPWGRQRFDEQGRLLGVDSHDGLGHIAFGYDHAGRRVSARTSGTAAPPVDLLTPDDLYAIESGVLVLYLAGCVRLAVGSAPLYLLHDHLGGIAMVTDAAGAVRERRYYDPYGALRARDGTPTAEPSRFAGGLADGWSGLLYLGARYYHPRLGMFVSPDPVVTDVFDPLAWAAYGYCRCNPVSFVDPSGRSFWRVFMLVVAVIALVALAVVTFGSGTPLSLALGVSLAIGVVGGGVVGGLAAARAKGDTGDIITGIIVGAAVGGWGASLSAGIAGAIMGKLGTGIAGSALAGGLGGAVNGTAMGFAAGFGAKSEAGAILTLMWQSALAGMVTGAVLGALSGAVNSGDIKKPDLASEYEKKAGELIRPESGARPPAPNTSGTMPDIGPRSPALQPVAPTSPNAVLNKAGTWAASPLLEAGKYYGGVLGAMAPIQVLSADLAGGAWGVFHEDISTYFRRSGIKVEF